VIEIHLSVEAVSSSNFCNKALPNLAREIGQQGDIYDVDFMLTSISVETPDPSLFSSRISKWAWEM